MSDTAVTLVEFLTARWDEDEARYREDAGDEAHQQWTIHQSGDLNEGYIVSEALDRLRDIAAKRKILAHHQRYLFTDVDQGIRASPACTVCCGSFNEAELDDDWRSVRDGTLHVNPAVYPCWTVRLLAEPFSDHPDYNPEWRTNA